MFKLSICCVILGLCGISLEVSTKLDFVDEDFPIVTNSSQADDNVEVKHTIVVSTSLRNNNRRGLQIKDDAGDIIYRMGNTNSKNGNSDEVPIVKAYKSVETTQIRTPDTRIKTTPLPEIFLNSNSRDEYDLYPNLAVNPMQWKPSPFYNNVNWRNQDSRSFDNYIPRNRPDYQKFHRRVTDDGVREFYCRKCREMSGSRGCHQQRSNSWIYSTTTPKIKIDGKLAKLN